MVPWYFWPPVIVGCLSAVTCTAIVLFIFFIERHDHRADEREARARIAEDDEVAGLNETWDESPSVADIAWFDKVGVRWGSTVAGSLPMRPVKPSPNRLHRGF